MIEMFIGLVAKHATKADLARIVTKVGQDYLTNPTEENYTHFVFTCMLVGGEGHQQRKIS
jgi:hypothetical protein